MESQLKLRVIGLTLLHRTVPATRTYARIVLFCVAKMAVTCVVAVLVDTRAMFRTVKQGGILAFIDI